MPQTLQCYKCGAQNTLGMSFCTACGEKFLYKCPQCGTNIEPSSAYCSGCSARLDWGTKIEQKAVTSTEPAKLAEAKQKEVEKYETKKKDQPKQRGLSPWFIAFIVAVLLIVAIFVVDTMFLGH